MGDIVIFEVDSVTTDDVVAVSRVEEILHVDIADPSINNVSLIEEVTHVELNPAAVASISVVEEVTHVETIGAGPPGPAASIEVGTTITGEPGTEAQVTNVGDESHAVLDFVIPRGPSAGTHHHIQAAPAQVWTINHNLGYRPSVNVQDSGGNQWFGDVKYLDDNSLTVTFAYPFGGTADLS